MERCDEDDIGIIPFQQLQYYANDDFGLMDEANFDHFIDLMIIRGAGETINHNQTSFNFCTQDDEVQSDAIAAVDSQQILLPPPPPVEEELFDFDVAAGHDYEEEEEEEEDDYTELTQAEEDESSGSGTRKKGGGGKSDRSRTLVSERKRRGRMKEKLYALRSLVPNITKMDKASIVGDAVSYVQGLQMQAKKLRGEIAGLDVQHTSTSSTVIQNGHKSNPLTCFYPITKKISKMDVCEVEERGFYVRMVAQREKGVAMLLYRALESLTTFHIRSSNLAASASASANHNNYVFTFTLHMMSGEMDVSLQSVKVWIASVFLNQGFEFQT